MNYKEELENRLDQIINSLESQEEVDPKTLRDYIELNDELRAYLYRFYPNFEEHRYGPDGQFPPGYDLWYKSQNICAVMIEKLKTSDLGIEENHALINIISDSYKGVATHSIYINHEISAAVSELYLYLAQQKKKVKTGEIPAFKFSDVKSITAIMELISNDPQKGKGQINSEWEQLLEQINKDLDVEFTSESFKSTHTK